MFASVGLAARVEGAEKRLTESLGGAVVATDAGSGAFVEDVCGGIAVYAGSESPMNKMIGVGFDGVPSGERLRDVEARFHERNAPVQAEVATLADPALVALLSRRGYALQNFENVSGRPLDGRDADARPDPAIEVSVLRPEDSAAWLDASITAFEHPDDRGVPAHGLPPREAMEASLRPLLLVPDFRRYCAWIDGQLAGTASLRIDNGIAQLCGAATLPAFRRRGVQGALLRRRLSDAFASGCDLAVLTTQPGSTSQENGHRQGFALLYSRAVLVQPPPAAPARA
jgi:ribosomal protein S18 acetylase RimI-like enzyme